MQLNTNGLFLEDVLDSVSSTINTTQWWRNCFLSLSKSTSTTVIKYCVKSNSPRSLRRTEFKLILLS